MNKALLFDLNGTMVDDMNYHIQAWYRISRELGAALTLEEVKAECYGKNGEVLERIFPGRFTEEEKNRISIEKEIQYRLEFKPYLKLLDGLDKFLALAHAHGWKMGIGSAAIQSNVDFVLDGLNIRHYFGAIVSADQVVHSKPDPETFLTCARLLDTDPSRCIVFEDAPKGVESAVRAGMKTVILTTMHEKHEFSHYPDTLLFTRDYTDPELPELLKK